MFVLALSVLATVLVSVASTPSSPVGAAPIDDATKYIAVTPIRVLDTASDPGRKALRAEGEITIAPITAAVAAAAGVDADDVQAVAINLTVFNTVGPGFTSVYPSGGDRPLVSSINSDMAGQAIPNVAIVKLGTGDAITIFSKSGSDIIVDVQGVLVASGATTAGRFVSVHPTRELDTRTINRPITARETRTIDLTGAGVPNDATAVALNVTVTETAAPGFLTVWRAGDDRPQPASNVNYPQADYTVANSVITGAANGSVDVFALAKTHVIIDVLGYFTGESADESTDGLYVPLVPRRFHDTRPDQPPKGTSAIGQERSVGVAIQGMGDIPDTGVAAIALNLGVTGAPNPGYLAAYAQETARPVPLSTVNMSFPFQTVANHTITQVSTAGGIEIFARLLAHAFVDVTGYFLGEPVPALTIAPDPELVPNIPPVGPADNDFAFSDQFDRGHIRDGGRNYLGWDPCSPITYGVNADLATQPMIDSLNEAIVQIELATGIDFQYRGRVTGRMFVPMSNDEDAIIDNQVGAEAVFGFANAATTPVLQGGTIGIGGLSQGFLVPGGNSTIYYEANGMALADIDDVPPGIDLQIVFMHEIAHMLGLGHVGTGSGATGEVMEPIKSVLTEFGNGDLNGLRLAGRAFCNNNRLSNQLQAAGESVYMPASWTVDS